MTSAEVERAGGSENNRLNRELIAVGSVEERDEGGRVDIALSPSSHRRFRRWMRSNLDRRIPPCPHSASMVILERQAACRARPGAQTPPPRCPALSLLSWRERTPVYRRLTWVRIMLSPYASMITLAGNARRERRDSVLTRGPGRMMPARFNGSELATSSCLRPLRMPSGGWRAAGPALRGARTVRR